MTDDGTAGRGRSELPRTVGRILLAAFLVLAGVGHLTFAREAFQAQVPDWLPFDEDFVVLASGVVEIGLGTALLAAPRRCRALVGWVVAAFFVAVFPGNIWQAIDRVDSLGLDSDAARVIRLFFQPPLVVLALWSTGAWRAFRRRRRRRAERAGGGAD